MKRIMAVYDVDPFYADRFAEFANQKEKTPFTAIAFNSLSRLTAFAAEQNVELLLVGDEVPEESIREVRARQVVRLGETAIGESKDENQSPVVYKYQASDAVLREVMACYRVQPQFAGLAAVGAKSTVISVYSPIGRCGKTGFCLTLGQIMAKQAKVLYLSLEDYSALSRLTGTSYSSALSDLIYYYRQGEYSRMHLSGLVYSWGGLDYIPPAGYAEDLAEMTGEELAGLVQQIAREGIYEVIILDMGHLAREPEPLLELSDVVYAPMKEDCISAAKLEAWKNYLNWSGKEHLWEKIQLLKLPMPGAVRQAETWLEQLLWGEMGDYIRGLLKGRKGEPRRDL